MLINPMKININNIILFLTEIAFVNIKNNKKNTIAIKKAVLLPVFKSI